LQKPLWCNGGNEMGGLQCQRDGGDKMNLAISLSLCLYLSLAVDIMLSLLLRAARCAVM
jgi:hypothetical protein